MTFRLGHFAAAARRHLLTDFDQQLRVPRIRERTLAHHLVLPQLVHGAQAVIDTLHGELRFKAFLGAGQRCSSFWCA